MTDGTLRTLIADPDYFGSLTAARDLGRSGHEIAVADVLDHVSRSASSRYCSRRLRAPFEHHSRAMVTWLLDVGREWPGAFLYPSSDDMAWRIAQSQDELRASYQLYQPPAQSTIGLLDKSQLYAHAAACGVPYPTTHAPVSPNDVRDLAALLTRTAAFPVIVKPRTQAGGLKEKGSVVFSGPELVRAIDELRQPGAYAQSFLDDAPANIEWPLVQQFMTEAAAHTYSLSGFLDTTGTVRTARASTKVFQIPVTVGVGIAFEGRPVRDAQIQAIEAIARASGYFGAFEAEFIHGTDGTHYLMDFNPRYYGQMNFEVSRGMRLPSIVFAAASGNDVALHALVNASQQSLRSDASTQRYCDRWLFRLLLRTQRLGGRLDAATRVQWLEWMNTGEVFDFLRAEDDPVPARVDRNLRWRHWIRYPRSSYKVLFR